MSLAAKNSLLDLSSFRADNLARLLPWRKSLLALLESWTGAFFFSDPDEGRQKEILVFLDTEGVDGARILGQLVSVDAASERKSICVSFRLLGELDEVSIPRPSRLYWAFGGLDSEDWWGQWKRLRTLGVDVVLSEALPEELPATFGGKAICEYVSKFRFLPPGSMDSGVFDERESSLGRLYSKAKATTRTGRFVAGLLEDGLPDGKGKRELLLFDHAQWIESFCRRATNDGSDRVILFAKWVSPLRWGRLRGGRLQNSVSIDGRQTLRAIVKDVEAVGYAFGSDESALGHSRWSYDPDTGFEGIDKISECYRASASEATALRAFFEARVVGSKNSKNLRWQFSPEFQGIVLRATEKGEVDEVLEDSVSSSLKALVCGTALCWAVAMKRERAAAALLEVLNGLRRENLSSSFGYIIWGLVESGHLPADTPYELMGHLVKKGKESRICDRNLESCGSLLDAISIWELSDGNWNYADMNVLSLLPFFGKSEIAKDRLERLERNFPLVRDYRTQLARMVTDELPVLMDKARRERFDGVLSFAVWCLESEYRSGKGTPATLGRLAWLLGLIGNWDPFDALGVESLPDETAYTARIRYCFAACLNGEGWTDYGKVADCPVDGLRAFEQLAVAFLELLNGGTSRLVSIAEKATELASLRAPEVWADDGERGALALYALNRVCGCPDAVEAIEGHWNFRYAKFGPYVEAIGRFERIESERLVVCMEKLNSVFLASAVDDQ